ncbi:MAG: hypothetical protein A2V66_16310 [Ignavibacteria bacterium RBG_13_36_8]|nr:MAG: hypothetical protein A2V66_16310 [Ignavibacteria bacterium RBG_13_36_8]
MNKKISFKVISACPCGSCANQKLPLNHPVCVPCSESNEWNNYKKNPNFQATLDTPRIPRIPKIKMSDFTLEDLEKLG